MFNNLIVSIFERLFFKPTIFDWFLITLLSPLSFLYGLFMLFRRLLTIKEDFQIPIVSIGNLTVGGSGKTPFLISLASKYRDSYIISRGYGRESRGLIEVSSRGKILTDVFSSGDEAMLMARKLPNSSIIVSEDRKEAIRLAKERGAKVIFLDDGFNRVDIEKFEILLFPKEINNYLPFPAGGFRELYFSKIFADLNLIEDRDFRRVVTIKNPTDRMILVTAISNPKRLESYLPKNIIKKIYLKDHSYFNENELKETLSMFNGTSLLITQKDEVKMSNFNLPLSLMELKLEINSIVFNNVESYIKKFDIIPQKNRTIDNG